MDFLTYSLSFTVSWIWSAQLHDQCLRDISPKCIYLLLTSRKTTAREAVHPRTQKGADEQTFETLNLKYHSQKLSA